MIMGSNSKTCFLDPIPTALHKKCIDSLLPILVTIVNLSCSASIFPDNLKLAMVLPLLEKVLLDIEDKKHYRPVLNLPYVVNLLKRLQ